MNNLLEAKAKEIKKGPIPVLRLPVLAGRGWEDLQEASYEVTDHIVPAQGIHLSRDGIVTLSGLEEEFRLTSFSATGFAWCSLSEDRACETERAVDLINAGFQEQDKNYMLRTTEGGTIISIVSPGYYPLKNSTIIEGISHLKKDMDMGVWYLNPYKTGIPLQSKKKFKMNKEELFAGALIKNGEQGKKSMEIISRMVQYICGNGVMIGSGITNEIVRRHNGGDDNWRDFDIIGAVSEIVTNTMKTQGFFEHLENLALRNPKAKEDVMKTVIAQGQMGPKQAQGLVTSYNAQRELRNRHTGETMYDVFNAVTGLKDYFPKTRLEWEELGGRIMLNPSDFFFSQN